MNLPQTSVGDMALGSPGQLTGSGHRVVPCVSEEDTAEIPFGYFVVQGDGDDGALLPSTVNDLLKGIVVKSHSFERDVELGSTGIKPLMSFGALRVGPCKVQLPYGTCAPGDGVHVQVVAETHYPAGTVRNNKSTNKTIDISEFAGWLTSGTAGDIVELDINLVNVGLAVAGS